MLACVLPRGAVQCQTADGNDAMNMRMVKEVLSSRMEHAEKPDVRSQVLRVGSNVQ